MSADAYEVDRARIFREADEADAVLAERARVRRRWFSLTFVAGFLVMVGLAVWLAARGDTHWVTAPLWAMLADYLWLREVRSIWQETRPRKESSDAR